MALRTITALAIGAITFDNSNYLLEEITGLEFPTARLPRYNLPGQSGAFISNALYGERKISIKGAVNAPDGKRSTLLNNRIALINALAYTYDASNIPQPLTVAFTLETGGSYTIEAYPSENMPLQMAFSPDQVDFEEFQLTLVCPGYTILSQTQSTSSVNLPVGGGVAIPTAVPASLAAASGGSVVIDNVGAVPAYPVITLSPDLTDPYIVNNTTGQFLSLNYTLNLGDQNIVIDCGAQTITQGSNDITGIQSSDSTFWSLAVGNNTIGFSAAGGTGLASIAYYPQYLGV